MAFSVDPFVLPADKTERKKKNWRIRMGDLFSNSAILHPNKNKRYCPNKEDMDKWKQSFDELLGHKHGKVAFELFLRREYSVENIEFWTACEEYKRLKLKKQMVSKAKRIYEEFIMNGAPKEINLDFHTKNAIKQSLNAPTKTTFLAAQKKIYNLMENNAYPRFINAIYDTDLLKDVSLRTVKPFGDFIIIPAPGVIYKERKVHR